MAIQQAVLYIPYAIYLKEQNSNIIKFVQLEDMLKSKQLTG